MAIFHLVSKAITLFLNTRILKKASKRDYYTHLMYLEAPGLFAAPNPFYLLLTMLYTLKVTNLWWPHIFAYYVALFTDVFIEKDTTSIALGEIVRHALILILMPLGIEAFIIENAPVCCCHPCAPSLYQGFQVQLMIRSVPRTNTLQHTF